MLTRLLIFLCFFNFISSQSYSQNYKKATKFYKEGNALYSIGDFDSAIDLFLKSLKSDPDFCPAIYKLGLSYKRINMFSDYKNWLLVYNDKLCQQNKDDVSYYLGEFYFLSGNISESKKYFDSIDDTLKFISLSKYRSNINYYINNTNNQLIYYIKNDSNQTIIMMGAQTCSRRSSEYFPLKVLESYLSYGMSAALFKLFREKHGITYDLGVYYPIRSGNAPFLIYLSVSNDQALFAFELLSTLWKNLLLNPLTDAEIFLAKEKLKGSFLLGNQSLDEILQRKIQLVSYGISPISENDLNSKIEEISSLDILKLTNKYLSKPFLSISGNKNICLEISNRWKKNF